MSETPPLVNISDESGSQRPGRGRGTKWDGWMDRALVRQVLATDPITCGRGQTATKWKEVAEVLQDLEPQPIVRSAESCRQRVKKLIEIYKRAELSSLRKTGTDEEFGEFELNMIELTTRWDQCSTDPNTRKIAREKAAELELDGKRVREDSMRGMVQQWEEEGGEGSNIGAGRQRKRMKKQSLGKSVDNILAEFMEGMKKDEKDLREIEERQEEKHEDLMHAILGLTDEIWEQSERRSHDAYLEREARKDELVLILEALRKNKEI